MAAGGLSRANGQQQVPLLLQRQTQEGRIQTQRAVPQLPASPFLRVLELLPAQDLKKKKKKKKRRAAAAWRAGTRGGTCRGCTTAQRTSASRCQPTPCRGSSATGPRL